MKHINQKNKPDPPNRPHLSWRADHRRSALQYRFSRNLLVRGDGRFWAEPDCVLEDALRAGVVDELLTTDETLLHWKLTPGAEAIGKIR
jgi:hypothetical protein